MNDIARQIRILVDEASGPLARMEPDQVSSNDRPGEWSKKEILGHLIDSAANNHQRFVRAVYNAAATFPAYDQNAWVQIQHYRESDWAGLVALWSAYNRHLSDVVERLPEGASSASCNIGQAEPVPLEFVVRDYLRHVRHHLNDILDKDR
jgi:hypothetical protein